MHLRPATRPEVPAQEFTLDLPLKFRPGPDATPTHSGQTRGWLWLDVDLCVPDDAMQLTVKPHDTACAASHRGSTCRRDSIIHIHIPPSRCVIASNGTFASCCLGQEHSRYLLEHRQVLTLTYPPSSCEAKGNGQTSHAAIRVELYISNN